MKLLIDTREQRPLPFRIGGEFSTIEPATLEVGDYAVILETTPPAKIPIRFERKSVADLYGTMTSGYPRFKKEMQKATTLDLALIVLIEGTLTEVAQGFSHSTFAGTSMCQKLFTLQVRHRLPIIFCQDRREMMTWITEYSLAIGRAYVATHTREEQMQKREARRATNDALADCYNTVLKMANKRALVAGVLNVTAASNIFTQDVEDFVEVKADPVPAKPPIVQPVPVAEPSEGRWLLRPAQTLIACGICNEKTPKGSPVWAHTVHPEIRCVKHPPEEAKNA